MLPSVLAAFFAWDATASVIRHWYTFHIERRWLKDSNAHTWDIQSFVNSLFIHPFLLYTTTTLRILASSATGLPPLKTRCRFNGTVSASRDLGYLPPLSILLFFSGRSFISSLPLPYLLLIHTVLSSRTPVSASFRKFHNHEFDSRIETSLLYTSTGISHSLHLWIRRYRLH